MLSYVYILWSKNTTIFKLGGGVSSGKGQGGKKGVMKKRKEKLKNRKEYERKQGKKRSKEIIMGVKKE